MTRICDLKQKEVINVKDGCRLGYVSDVEIDLNCGCIQAIIVDGPCKIFGIFGKETEYIICWDDIKKIGDDIIIIDVPINNIIRNI